ncbi:uncharacterized protein LOC130210955 isoform X2 [Pseudoliparis swirei]|uniref:uncharacterized protein LOC130210955 isoform X2 n=1 Tax=Pseudoliparis swirei TaxID=2059687 RepID=UPI0024BDDCC6|nr:uncharacterized protein LOC130210955 isoform X2 [Pseudoliparis swirei]
MCHHGQMMRLNWLLQARLWKTCSTLKSLHGWERHSQGSCPTEGTKQQKQPEPAVSRKQLVSYSQPTETPSTSRGPDYSVESPQSDSPVELEGSVRLWENPNGVPCADVSWLKEDTERGLFTPVQMFKDSTGQLKRRRVMKADRMWFYPPEPPGYVKGALPTVLWSLHQGGRRKSGPVACVGPGYSNPTQRGSSSSVPRHPDQQAWC